MQTGYDHASVVLKPVEQPVGESLDASGADVLEHDGVNKGVLGKLIDDTQYLPDKLTAKTWPLLFVPAARSVNIRLRGSSKEN